MKFNQTALSPIALALLALLPAACSGGGQGSVDSDTDDGSDDGSDTIQPDATVVFPPAFSLTDAEVVLVRGTATDPELITCIKVHGTSALSADGFSSWSAEVPLDVGTTTLEVDLHTTDGEHLPAVDSITVVREGGLLGEGIDMAFSEDGLLGPEAWYLDRDKVLRQDVLTAEVQIASGPERGEGPAFEDPCAITASPTGERVYVLGELDGACAILEIDTISGDRTELSGPNVGEGPPLDGALDLDYFDYQGPNEDDMLLVCHWTRPGLTFVNLSTGERTFEPVLEGTLGGARNLTVFNDPGISMPRYVAVAEYIDLFVVDLSTGSCIEVASKEVGNGPLWGSPTSFAFTDRGELRVLDKSPGEVYSLDFQAMGFPRELLSARITSGGAPLDRPAVIVPLDSIDLDFIAVMDERMGTVVRLDRDDVEWTPLLAPSIGSGSALGTPKDLVKLQESVLVVARASGELLQVDDADGNRYPLVSWGDPESERKPETVCVDEEAGIAFLFDYQDKYFYMLDLESGEATPISGPDLGEGYLVGSVLDLAYDSQEQRLFTLGSRAAFLLEVFEVDIVTGDRRVLSGWEVGEGPFPIWPRDMILDREGMRFLLLEFADLDESSRVLEVDLTTGDRRILSGDGVGSGVELNSARGMDYCPIRDELLLLNGDNTLILVDPLTGHRQAASTGNYQGTAPRRARRLQWDPEREILYTLDFYQWKLMAYDLVGDQWMVLSR